MNLWICLFMEKDFSLYQSNDVQLIKCMFVLCKFVLKGLLISLPDMSMDEQINMIKSDYPYDPTRPPIPNKIELEGRYYGVGARSYRRMLFCIAEKVFFHLEHDVICLSVNMEDEVDDIHFYAA